MGDRDGRWFFCCRHCAPGCGYNNRHALGCAQGCLPYARQEEDETMPETPWFAEKITSDTPTNIPAEALQEMLDFERARWDEERAELTEQLDKTGALAKMLDNFVLATAMNLGAVIHGVRRGLGDADEALDLFFTDFIDQMPTPSKIDMQEHLDEDHALAVENTRDAQALVDFLVNMGYDPEEIISAKRQADSDFVQTVLGGMMSASFNDEPISDDDLEADDDPDS